MEEAWREAQRVMNQPGRSSEIRKGHQEATMIATWMYYETNRHSEESLRDTGTER